MATGGKNNQEPKIAPTHRGKNWGKNTKGNFREWQLSATFGKTHTSHDKLSVLVERFFLH